MKKFLIIGNMNAVAYKEIFPLFKDNKIWLGVNNRMDFIQDKNTMNSINSRWFTNLPHNKRHNPITLIQSYSAEIYLKYDNYDAINVDKVCDIPLDYDGVMGVPITFLDKYCPEQFEILDARDYALNERQKNKNTYLIKDADGAINGKPTYARILIKSK